METISELVSYHQQYLNSTELRNSLGDGLLFTHHPLFRKLRNEVHLLEVKFTDQTDPFYYEACPHLALRRILETRTIPYVKNSGALFEMARIAPQLPIGKILEIKKNKIMHESAHLLADSVFSSDKALIQKEQSFVLSSLLCESFASACETVGQIFCIDPYQRWMYRQNTNVFGCEEEDYQKLLLEVTQTFGMKTCFKLAWMSFFCWSIFFPQMQRGHLESIQSLLNLPSHLTDANWETMLRFSNFHFRVRNWFRNEVAEFYFRMHGLQKPLAVLLNRDFLSELNDQSFWNSRIETLSCLVIENLA